MIRAHATAVALAGAIACAGALAVTSAADPRAAASTHLQVTAVEYRLMLSEAVVRAGPVSLELIDAGMDPHDLRLRHAGPGATIAEPELDAGQRFDGVVDLVPGIYHLWCSLPQHRRLGMRAALRVVR